VFIYHTLIDKRLLIMSAMLQIYGGVLHYY